MPENQKTGLMWMLTGLLLVVMCVVIFWQAPSPFVAIVEPEPVLSAMPIAESTTVPTTVWTTRNPDLIPLDRRVNINTLDVMEWRNLLGDLRMQLAFDIVKYRKENGPFESLDELLNVPGFEEETLEWAAAYLTIE